MDITEKGNCETYNFSYIQVLENSPLIGKHICVLGSSVAFGSASQENAVGEYLAKRFGAKLTKEAVSGTTLADSYENSYVQRLKRNIPMDMPFDLFVCQLSTNDTSKNVPLGTISPDKNGENFDTSTIIGAIEYIICYAQKTWNCPVVFFTGSRFDNALYGEMVSQLSKLKDKWGIWVLDLWSDDDFNDISDQDRQLYMNDPIHPLKAGYRDWWGPELERQLCSYLGIRR